METQNSKGRIISKHHFIHFFRESLTARLLSWMLLIAMLNLSGCYYYKVNHLNNPTPDNIRYYKSIQKKFLVVSGDNVYQIKDEKFENDIISGMVEPLYDYNRHLTTKPTGSNRYLKNRDQNILREVLLYVNDFKPLEDNAFVIPFDSINKIEIYEQDKGATARSYLLGGFVVFTSALGTIFFFAILSASCPFIYVFDGEEYAFEGEIYSGATQPQLERHDYLRLPLKDLNSSLFQLKISNELREIQHTNLMELLVYDHPESVEILTDKYGVHHSLSNLNTPLNAVTLAGKNVLSLVEKQDSLVYLGEDPLEQKTLTDGVILEFEQPEFANNAKLVIKAKNSFLLDYNLNRFHELFGKAYHDWQANQQNAPADLLKQWSLDQNIPLSVYIERNNEWEYVDYYNIIGPMAFKEDVLSIPVDFTNEGPLRIKLEYGAYFWEVDYVGIDFSENTAVTKHIVPLQSAINQLGEDVAPLLSGDDDQYYIQPEIGDEAVVKFALPALTDESRSLILHTKGHYQVIRDPRGRPDRQYLQSFRQPGQFNRFTIEHLQALARAISE